MSNGSNPAGWFPLVRVPLVSAGTVRPKLDGGADRRIHPHPGTGRREASDELPMRSRSAAPCGAMPSLSRTRAFSGVTFTGSEWGRSGRRRVQGRGHRSCCWQGRASEGAVEDLEIPQTRLADSAARVVDRAVDEAHRREHGLLTNEHICLAFAQVEWDLFGQIMRDAGLNPHEFVQALEEHLRLLPGLPGGPLRVAPATKLLFKLALLRASRAGRHAVEAVDLFSAVFEETQGVPVSILRRQGVEPEALVSRLAVRLRHQELKEERLRKRFELPPFLKHFATNLNQLAWQDRLPPVFGREAEMQQVLEVLCHRERANSVLLVGEPGVGKTAIVEGLARRIEFEPDTVPVRLRDCQIVNLQMNTMVAGTMLRGMFEDRKSVGRERV